MKVFFFPFSRQFFAKRDLDFFLVGVAKWLGLTQPVFRNGLKNSPPARLREGHVGRRVNNRSTRQNNKKIKNLKTGKIIILFEKKSKKQKRAKRAGLFLGQSTFGPFFAGPNGLGHKKLDRVGPFYGPNGPTRWAEPILSSLLFGKQMFGPVKTYNKRVLNCFK